MAYALPVPLSQNSGDPVLVNFFVPEQQNLSLFFASKNYKITVSDWLSEGWQIYKLNWPVYLTFAVLYMLIINIPYVGFILVVPVQTGFYYMMFNYLRPYISPEDGQLVFNNKLDVNEFFKGISKFAGSTLVIFLLYLLGVALGFICLVIPGIYLSIVWGEVIALYIEFSDYPFAFNSYTDYFTLCRRHLHKQFWQVSGAYILIYLFAISGFLLLIVGLVVTVPVAMIMSTLMFRDIFGLRAHSTVAYNPYSYSAVQPVTMTPMYTPTENTENMGMRQIYPPMNVVQYGSGVPISSVAYPTTVISPNQIPPQ